MRQMRQTRQHGGNEEREIMSHDHETIYFYLTKTTVPCTLPSFVYLPTRNPGIQEYRIQNAERWRNMKTELTSKMWGVFEETGLFLTLCRHGFVLLLVDMVHNGEL